jgi:xanthine dehydrogenase accessory factor
MFEISDRLLAAAEAGAPIAVATAVSITGSAPRTIGTSMAFDGEHVIGSIAGGCVEGAVVGVCEEVLADGIPRTVEYGVSDETAFSVGLTCGGQLRIHVTLLTDAMIQSLQDAAAGRTAGLATVLNGSQKNHRIASELEARVSTGQTALTTIECEGELLEVFFETFAAPPRMIIFGSMEFSAALSNAAQVLGYRVTICDPRPLFTTATRFPGAELVVAWPTTYLATTDVDERTAICVLSHDARFDAELVAQCLELPVGFVGAMGSRRTHDRRIASLRERSVPEESIARLRSPIGLDIGSSTPEETAISILAEIIAVRTRGSAAPLTSTDGAIHRPLHATEPATQPANAPATQPA